MKSFIGNGKNLSMTKIRLSRVQKQIYLHFAEAKYLRRSQRYEKEGAIVRVCTQELPNRFL
ncbi:hypothetical protein, partial [Alistipes putredinis]|uniref:hypothetical protein n=1 Tax=Alistipes putredinis TaxID=28117 RepID=UPI003A909A31